MISKKDLQYLAKNLSVSAIDAVQKLHGGDIHEAFRLRIGQQSLFLKTNSKENLNALFESEAKGLALLNEASTLKVPAVIKVLHQGQNSYLITEFVEKAEPNKSFWQNFAAGLAQQHRKSNEAFGLSHNNYIATLLQSNTLNASWSDFFILERIEPMLKMAIDKATIPRSDLGLFDRLFALLSDFFPEEKPALLHGDLWSGNFIACRDSQACIFDPAVYFGHREMDLAMTTLFGGFDKAFYDAYQDHFPLEPAWSERLPIANLYPLLVHLNLFRSAYYQQIQNTLKTYC